MLGSHEYCIGLFFSPFSNLQSDLIISQRIMMMKSGKIEEKCHSKGSSEYLF